MRKLILLSAITFWFNLAMGQDTTSGIIDVASFSYPSWDKPSYRKYGNSGDSLVVIDSLQSILVGIAREKMVYEWLEQCRDDLRKSYMDYNKLVDKFNDHLRQDRKIIRSLKAINSK